jgi:hypothetical protein
MVVESQGMRHRQRWPKAPANENRAPNARTQDTRSKKQEGSVRQGVGRSWVVGGLLPQGTWHMAMAKREERVGVGDSVLGLGARRPSRPLVGPAHVRSMPIIHHHTRS